MVIRLSVAILVQAFLAQASLILWQHSQQRQLNSSADRAQHFSADKSAIFNADRSLYFRAVKAANCSADRALIVNIDKAIGVPRNRFRYSAAQTISYPKLQYGMYLRL